MFGWFSGSIPESERILRDTSLEDADVIYAGARDRTTRRNLVREFDDRDLNVTDLNALEVEEQDKDIFVGGVEASELEGKTVFYREANFLADLDDREEKMEKRMIMNKLEHEFDINFFNPVAASFNCQNKIRTKQILRESYQGLDNVRVADTYDSLDEVEDKLSGDERVVRKPDKGSLGRGIEFLEAENLEESDFESDHYFFEECVDHSAENVKEVRALDLGEGRDNKIFVEREKDSGELEPKNIDQGGYYKSHSPSEAEQRAIERASQALDPFSDGMDFGALDYLLVEKEEDVEVIVLEYNSTPGTKVSEFYEENMRSEQDPGFYEKIAESVEKRHNDFNTRYSANSETESRVSEDIG